MRCRVNLLRITSYNVCYTKLLRIILHLAVSGNLSKSTATDGDVREEIEEATAFRDAYSEANKIRTKKTGGSIRA